MNETILTTKSIVKHFAGVTALNDVSVDLRHGEILSICGENGAGKSTLMKILAGDHPHGSYEGEILIDGQKQRFVNTAAAKHAGIAMIYQEISVELDLSVAENILLGILPLNRAGLVDWKQARMAATEALARLKLTLDVNILARNLSASVQQLVCIARALVRNPKILILDEPTAALTEAETENLMQVILKLREGGISCIYISHKLDEVFRISDRLVTMRDGKVVATYERAAIRADRVIEDMIGRKLEAMYPDMSGRALQDEVLRIEHFCVQHPSSAVKHIIEDISFSLRKGEVLGLAGLVGSGRSELLRAVFGALPKLGGRVFIDGREVHITSPASAIRHGLGLLTEERKKDGIISTMNIGENMTLSIFGKISRHGLFDRKLEAAAVSRYFKSLAIKAPSHRTAVTSLSGGNQQKVVLAKSLMTDMKVLFLDEPTRGIDVGAKSEIYKIIKELADGGLSIVMISSEYPELLAMCDRFVVIGNGRIVGEMAKAEATESRLIKLASMVE
jgi:ABC-type sugar transport system ATPase subunit